MSILKGKKGIVFGALNEASIAWKVAELCAKEGAEIVLTNAPVSARVGQTAELAEKLNAPLIYADVTKMEDLETLVSESMDKLGGKLDFVLHMNSQTQCSLVCISCGVRFLFPHPKM